MYFFSIQRVVAPKEWARGLAKRRRRVGVGKLATVRNSTFRSISKSIMGVIAVVTLAAAISPVGAQAAVPRGQSPLQPAQHWINGDSIRLDGADRYETAVKVSEYEFGAPGVASKIVVASGENFPDALVAGPLASLLNAPLVLTRNAELPEIARRNIKWVFDGVADASPDVLLIGGAAAISDTVVDQIEAIHPNLDVMRLKGDTRVETALEVATQFELSQSVPNEVFIVNGLGFADALSASGPASDRGINYDLSPILLNDSTSSLNASLRAYLEARTDRINRIHLIGGYSVLAPSLSTEIYAIFTAQGKNPAIDQITGQNRYETSANVAEIFYGNKDPRSVGIANGEKFPDALVGGQDSGKAFMSNMQQAFVLVQPDAIPAPVQYFLELHKGTLTSAVIYGGTASVSEDVHLQLISYL